MSGCVWLKLVTVNFNTGTLHPFVWRYQMRIYSCTHLVIFRTAVHGWQACKQFFELINNLYMNNQMNKIMQLTCSQLQKDMYTNHVVCVHLPTDEQLLATKCHFFQPSDYYCTSEEAVYLLTRSSLVVHSTLMTIEPQYPQIVAPSTQATSHE